LCFFLTEENRMMSINKSNLYTEVPLEYRKWYTVSHFPAKPLFQPNRRISKCGLSLKVALRPLYDGLIVEKWLAMWKIVNFIFLKDLCYFLTEENRMMSINKSMLSASRKPNFYKKKHKGRMHSPFYPCVFSCKSLVFVMLTALTYL
jgi:hypothetical protein